jgi:hypothetical protein
MSRMNFLFDIVSNFGKFRGQNTKAFVKVDRHMLQNIWLEVEYRFDDCKATD